MRKGKVAVDEPFLIQYVAPIDPHVHFRWNEYANFPFMEWGFSDAQAVGLAAVILMPNTTPTLNTRVNLDAYMRLAFEKCAAILGGAQSGTPNIPVYPYMVAKLREYGMPEERLEGLLFGTANNVFALGLPARQVQVRNNPHLWTKYGQNLYR